MAKPTKDELHIALAEAARMREQDEDPHYLAKCLLNHHFRLGYLEEVMLAVERYLHSGLAEAEHQRLLKVLEKARQAEAHISHSEHGKLGLG